MSNSSSYRNPATGVLLFAAPSVVIIGVYLLEKKDSSRLYRSFQQQLAARVRDFLRRQYDIDLANVVIEQPPNVELGEYALPLAFELARKLRKPPRKIAEEVVGSIGEIPGFEKLEVAGAGYINARLKRGDAAAIVAAGEEQSSETAETSSKVIVEHSSINPNKAAHIGHLRNAILGDTFVRLLRSRGREVDVQNYIDNTGVQVADVVVGFLYVEKKTAAEIRELARQSKFDFLCWDVYARASQWYEESEANKQKRLDTLHQLEAGNNEVAEIADLVSTAILKRHLQTMDRLDIEYDLLPRESEIIHLHFWEAARKQLEDRGILYHETAGRKAGCWVMKRPNHVPNPNKTEDEQADDATKVLIRSNGTVVYEGKDIAYHLWKFGVLGRDFGYSQFWKYERTQKECWISSDPAQDDPAHPHFGGAREIYNVIDSRQAEAQNTVIEALRALGYEYEAEHYTHFSYEMVALTPRCAAELGYQLSEDDWSRAYIEVSGRKGFGVKADDLLDQLIASAKKEVDARHAELSETERRQIAEQIAVGALRYFMLKFTKATVIAFDFKEALSFEGETGPYAQYAIVRAANIFRKAGLDADTYLTAQRPEPNALNEFLSGDQANELWELWLAASKTSQVVEQCIATTEPAYLAKHAFYLAQLFNNFYHRHHILNESNERRKAFLLATAAVVRRELIRVLGVMGITAPSVM
ncbi:MAG: arginine--tRNA ligase [Terriglobales bacterium]